MKKEIHQINIQHLAFQRNAFILISFSLVLVALVLSGMLYFKEERVIIVPQGFNEKIWVKGKRVSKSYLKEQGNVVAMLFLSKSPSTAKEQARSLLEMSSPSLHGSLRAKLSKELEVLKEQGTSYLFLPSEVLVNEEAMSVEMAGDRAIYIGEKHLKTEKERYRFGFIFNGQRLLLDNVKREEIR